MRTNYSRGSNRNSLRSGSFRQKLSNSNTLSRSWIGTPTATMCGTRPIHSSQSITGDEARHEFAEFGFRPTNENVVQSSAAAFPHLPHMFTIADFGEWDIAFAARLSPQGSWTRAGKNTLSKVRPRILQNEWRAHVPVPDRAMQAPAPFLREPFEERFIGIMSGGCCRRPPRTSPSSYWHHASHYDTVSDSL